MMLKDLVAQIFIKTVDSMADLKLKCKFFKNWTSSIILSVNGF